jgi:hypothetical protein
MCLSPPLWRVTNERVNKLFWGLASNGKPLKYYKEQIFMQITIGCFYFIKDIFFDIIDDSELMQNKENGRKRPCYYCFKSKEYKNIIWFIPVSTKVDKYKKVYDNKLKKQIKLGKKPSIDTIVFGNVANTYSAFLIQNMFPVTEEYVESQYFKNKVPIKLSNKLQEEIINKATKVLNLYNHGMKNIIFPNIDKILEQLL